MSHAASDLVDLPDRGDFGWVLGGVLFRSWIASPRYALQDMALALKTRDMPQFFKYLNIKAIANNLAESAIPNSEDAKGGTEDRGTGKPGKWGGSCPSSVV